MWMRPFFVGQAFSATAPVALLVLLVLEIDVHVLQSLET